MQTVGEWWMWAGFIGFVLAMLTLSTWMSRRFTPHLILSPERKEIFDMVNRLP